MNVILVAQLYIVKTDGSHGQYMLFFQNVQTLILALSIGVTHAYCMKSSTSISVRPPARSQYVL